MTRRGHLAIFEWQVNVEASEPRDWPAIFSHTVRAESPIAHRMLLTEERLRELTGEIKTPGRVDERING